MTLTRDATGFRTGKTESGDAFWVDATGHRVIVQRAPNRFQAFQWLDDDHLSVGYTQTPDDIRLFLAGHGVELAVWFEHPDDAIRFQHPSLTTF